ncbi:MAG: DNA-binding domain-containing protein [Rhodobacteraceae bacterium]|nr:DNA-binding domain-containing protein [Paracoccaceae bacterium]
MRQSEFIASICNPERAVPNWITSRASRHDRRFSVYRNNVIVNLIEALEGGFPIVRKIVGDEFFRAMAGAFVRRHPPQSPILTLFGGELPGFLEDFEPVRTLPYLPDTARLELALRRSYHAADHKPAPAQHLSGMSPDQIEGSCLELAPSFELLRSRHPIHGIWLANTGGKDKPVAVGEDVAVVRRGFDPEPRLLKSGEFEFLRAIRSRESLGNAFASGMSASPAFDLDDTLAWLLGSGVVAGFRPGGSSGDSSTRNS